jgi:hypothetical protein
VLVGLISNPITSINLIFAPTHASLSAIIPLIVATNAFIHQLDAFISLAMLYLMNHHFPSRPSLLPRTHLLFLHTPLPIPPSFHAPPSPRVTHALQITKTPPPCPSARLPLPLLLHRILLTLLLHHCRFYPITRMPHWHCLLLNIACKSARRTTSSNQRPFLMDSSAIRSPKLSLPWLAQMTLNLPSTLLLPNTKPGVML